MIKSTVENGEKKSEVGNWPQLIQSMTTGAVFLVTRYDYSRVVMTCLKVADNHNWEDLDCRIVSDDNWRDFKPFTGIIKLRNED